MRAPLAWRRRHQRGQDISKTIGASQDVTLFGGSDATTNNTSSGPGMFVGSDGTSPKRGIVEFDIADNVPAGATITSATLTLYLGMVAGSGGGMGGGADATPRTIRLFDVTTAWNPTTLGTTGKTGIGGTGHGFDAPGVTPAGPNAGDATWNWAKYNQVQWSTAGGDFASTESADALVSQSVGTGYTWTSTQMAANVQAWLNGTMANDGWLLKNDTENVASFRAFYTAEGAVELNVPLLAPSLTITYTAAVPEPASLMLLAAAMPLFFARRRQSTRSGV